MKITVMLIARDKGNAKKLEELSVLLFTSLAAGKE